MNTPAWKVCSWAPVNASIDQWNLIVEQFRPLGATVCVDEDDGLHHGQVIWGLEKRDCCIGIAWDWREAFPGVIAMSDPMTVVSNVALYDCNEIALSDSSRIVQLNNGIYQLAWQSHINAEKRSSEAAMRKMRATKVAANHPSQRLTA